MDYDQRLRLGADPLSVAAPYALWIERRLALFGDLSGLCAETTADMLETFPELIRVRGHAIDSVLRRHPHWWLVDLSGHVADPTVSQFIHSIIFYDPHEEGSDEPTGRCMNCGEYLYRGQTFCDNDVCEDETFAHLKGDD